MTKRVAPEIDFYKLCASADIDRVEQALRQYGSYLVHQPNEEGKMPLDGAYEADDVELTEVLLENGASCHYIDAKGETLFYHAVCQSFVEMVTLFLRFTPSITILNNLVFSPQQDSLLITACIYNKNTEEQDVQIIKSLLAKGVDPFYRNCLDDNAAEMCCTRGTLNTVRAFIESVDEHVLKKLLIGNQTRGTLLSFAASNRKYGPEIIKYLISKGANPAEEANSEISAYSRAYTRANISCLTALPARHINYIAEEKPNRRSYNPLGIARAAIPYGYDKTKITGDYLSRYFIYNRSLPRYRWIFYRHMVVMPPFPFEKREEHVADYILWFRETCTRSPTFVLHFAASHSLELTREAMKCWYNPLLHNAQGKLPVDVAATPEIRRELEKYATWDANVPQKTWWYQMLPFCSFCTVLTTKRFGPYFQLRARAFLLVCQRLSVVLPKPVRYMIVAHMAKNEVVYV